MQFIVMPTPSFSMCVCVCNVGAYASAGDTVSSADKAVIKKNLQDNSMYKTNISYWSLIFTISK